VARAVGAGVVVVALVVVVAAASAATTAKKRKSIPVRGGGGPYVCERLRLLHLLDGWLTDDGEVISLTCWLLCAHRKTTGTHFC
jgi:hypothetical protein